MKRIISLLLTFFIIFSASLPLYVLAEEDMSDIQFTPTNGPSGEISYTEPLTVSFSDVVDSSTVNSETIKLYKDGFDVGLESSDIKVSGEVVTINTPKSPYSTYILEVRSAISSENGNSFDEDVLYTFETCVNENEINLSSSKFLSAVYLPTNPDHTGDRKSSSGGSGWLPYLYAGGTFRHYYCIIDISSLSGKNISEVIYKAFMNGSVNASLYEIDGDFTPGTTPYSELPEIGDVFATVTEAGGNGKYVDIDITSQVKKLLSEGKTELKFMLRQNVGNQSSIANESSQWSDGSWGPSVVAKYADASFSGVISTTPAAYEHLFATDGELSASLSTKPESVDASNITLINENTGDNVALSDADIMLDESNSKIIITPPFPLSPMSVYSLKIAGIKDTDGNTLEEKKILFGTSGNESDYVPVYSEVSGTSFVKVSVADDYSGKLKIAGKLFGCSEAPVNLIVSKADSDTENPDFIMTSVTNKNGYFSFDADLPHGGTYIAYVSSFQYLGKALKSGKFKCYSQTEYADVWNKLSSGDAASVKSVISTAYDMFEIFKDKEEIFGRYDYICNLIANGSPFGEYTKENIAAMREAVYDAYIISGFVKEKDKSILADAIEKLASQYEFDKLDNFADYSSMEDKYKEMTADEFLSAIGEDASSFEEISSTLHTAIDSAKLCRIFDMIAEASNYTQVSEIILNESNKILLGLTSDDIEDFKANSINAAKHLTGKKFTSLSEFKEEFIYSLTTSDNRVSTGGGGGGGGGSVIKGSSGSIVYDTPSTPEKEEPALGENADQAVSETELYFTDISDYPWAKTEIEFLYRMGVIDGTGNHTYSPSQSLTREQYVKLIVEAFEFETENASKGFDDVSSDDWYYSYVTTAEALGIAYGNGTSFGVGQAVTREDLCVMTQRALNAAGYKTDAVEPEFSDSASISDYAKNSVAFLAKNGIINGMPDGSFCPKNATTRAEAAVILYRLSEYIKNFAATIWKSAASALDKVEAPTEAQILADINKKLNPKTVKHPYIHGTYDKLVEIKNNISSGDEYSIKLYNMVKSSADELLDTAVVTPDNTVSQNHINIENRILALMVTHFIDGNEKYLNRAKDEFKNLQKITTWTAAAQLDNTQTAAAIAVCYDWLYDYLSEDERSWAVKTIKEKCVDIAYEYYKDPSSLSALRAANDNMNIWCWRGSYNHCIYNNSNLAIASLALAPLYPEYSAFVLYNNMYNIQPYFELVGKDGGHEEPVGYYGYTTGKAMNMLSAIHSALGTMYDYDRYHGFRTTAYYPLYIYGVGPFAFGDCSPAAQKFNSNFLYFAAKHSKNAELLSLINDRLEASGSAKVLLWYDKGEMNNVEEGMTLSLDKKISPVSMGQNVVAFRDHWNIESGFFAAMYAGNGNANGHSDAVSGAFGIDAFGERFITPMGLGNYDYPDYWVNSQGGGRWNWYEKRPEGNNCLVINPSEAVGQKVDVTAVFGGFESGEGAAYAWTDLSEVYADNVISYKRGIRVHNSRSKIIIQDEAVMPKPSEIFWSANTPGDIEIISSDTALITLNGKKMAVKVWANADFELYEMPAEKLPTSPQKTEQRVIRAYRKIAVKAHDVTDFKLMVEFIPVVTESEIPESPSEFVAIDNWSADEKFYERPVADEISIGGTTIEDFNSGKYNYNIKYDVVPETVPEVSAKAANGYEVSVTYPEGDVKKAVVEVKSENRCAYYEIIFTQKPVEIDTSVLKKYTPSAITATDNDGNIPENVADGKPDTRWSASGEGQKPCLDIDLGSVKNIKAIGISFYEGTKRQSYFEIYTSSDGSEWTKNIVLGESSGLSNDIELFALDASARYVRYEGQQNSLNHWNSVTEIEIFGE